MTRYVTKTLNDVRKEMETGHPFRIVYCKFNESKGTGGERAELGKAVLVMNDQTISKEEREKKYANSEGKPSNSKMPLHWLHNTFNVRVPNVSHPIKIHWLLIEEFNSYKVTV